jgi:hypothetical protein
MRILLLLFVAAVTVGTRAEAQNYPWCAIYNGGAVGGGTNCGFTTFQQCMDTARGLGSNCPPNTIPAATRAASTEEVARALSILRELE